MSLTADRSGGPIGHPAHPSGAQNEGGVAVCRLGDLTPERGVAALVRGRQVALFRIDDADGVHVFAVDHRDPCTGANVLARGLVGSTADGWYVASPLHKQRFDLATGACLDDERTSVRTWSVSVRDGAVHVDTT
jgi:nitrite reductase (NADH) small subunit